MTEPKKKNLWLETSRKYNNRGVYMDCPCPNKLCDRYMKCRECTSYHHERGELTACEKRRDEWKKREQNISDG